MLPRQALPRKSSRCSWYSAWGRLLQRPESLYILSLKLKGIANKMARSAAAEYPATYRNEDYWSVRGTRAFFTR